MLRYPSAQWKSYVFLRVQPATSCVRSFDRAACLTTKASGNIVHVNHVTSREGPIAYDPRCMKIINFILGAIAGLLAAAAIGAVWSLIGLATGGRAAWMAPVAALLLLVILRFNGHAPGWRRATASALLMLITIAHANYVMASGFIAASTGRGLLDALSLIGPDMAFAVVRAHSSPWEWLSYALALLGCLVLGYRQPGEFGRPTSARKRSRASA